MNQVAQMDPYVGKYFSIEFIRKKVLKQSDQEAKEIDKQIEEEQEAGLILSPEEQMAADMGMVGPEMEGDPAAGGAPADPKSQVDPADQKRGEI